MENTSIYSLLSNKPNKQFKMANNNKELDKEKSYKVTVEGSLGLLAFGDVGLRAWREVKKKSEEENTNETE